MATIKADVVIQASKDIKKSFDNGLTMALEPYMNLPMFDVYHTTDWDEEFVSTEGLIGTKALSELEEAPTNKLEEGYSVIIQPFKFGNGIEVSYDLMVKARDNRTNIMQYLSRERDKLIKDVKQYVINYMFDFFDNAFNTTSAVAPDAVALCGTHQFKSGLTFDNFQAGAFTMAGYEAMKEYAGAFKSADGKEQPIDFNTAVVKKNSPMANFIKQNVLFSSSPTKVADINIWEGDFTLIEVPYIKSANKANVFFFDSNAEQSLKVGFNEFPTLGTPKEQKNRAIYTDIVGLMKKGIVNLPKEWYGFTG